MLYDANKKEHEPKVIFIHAEGGYYDSEKRLLLLKSANLIDFMLEVFKHAGSSILILPSSAGRRGEVKFEIGRNVCVIDLVYPSEDDRKARQFTSTILFIAGLISKEMLQKIRRAEYSVSGSLDFVSTVYGVVRTLVVRRKHRFIVRGNRFETVRRSFRGSLNKRFALKRIKIYRKIMIYLVNSGRAELWFQGEEAYNDYLDKCTNEAKMQLFLLNAVLRNLPERAELFNSEKKFDIVFVGRITVEKGVFDLIKAISILIKEDFAITAVLIGDGRDKDHALKLAQSLGVSSMVRFYGYVSSPKQLANLIKGAKLFVLPSYTEGLPRAMLESMFLGVPVLVSPVGGIKYVIRDCENGFLVQSGVPRELARRIREILEQIETGKYDLLIRTAQSEAGAYTFSARAKYFLDRSVNRSN